MDCEDCDTETVNANNITSEENNEPEAAGEENAFTALLQLPQIQLPAISGPHMEPLIHYHNSILLTEEDHICNLEDVATRRGEAARERERKKLDMEANKGKQAEEKKQKVQAKEDRAEMARSKKRYKELWSLKNVKALGKKLHAAIKANEGCQTSYSGIISPICKENQKITLLRRRAKKNGNNKSHH